MTPLSHCAMKVFLLPIGYAIKPIEYLPIPHKWPGYIWQTKDWLENWKRPRLKCKWYPRCFKLVDVAPLSRFFVRTCSKINNLRCSGSLSSFLVWTSFTVIPLTLEFSLGGIRSATHLQKVLAYVCLNITILLTAIPSLRRNALRRSFWAALKLTRLISGAGSGVGLSSGSGVRSIINNCLRDSMSISAMPSSSVAVWCTFGPILKLVNGYGIVFAIKFC